LLPLLGITGNGKAKLFRQFPANDRNASLPGHRLTTEMALGIGQNGMGELEASSTTKGWRLEEV